MKELALIWLAKNSANCYSSAPECLTPLVTPVVAFWCRRRTNQLIVSNAKTQVSNSIHFETASGHLLSKVPISAVKKFTETYLTVAQPAKELEVQEMIQQTMLQEPNKQQPTRVVNQAFSAPVEYTPNSSYASTIETLNSKIQWATSELKNSHIVRYNIELCEMINAASQAIVSLKSASAQS